MTVKIFRSRGFYLKTATLAILMLFILPNITAMQSDPAAQVTMDRGGETFVVFEGADRAQFDDVVLFITESGGRAYAMNPPNSLRADLPMGSGSSIYDMPGVRGVYTGKVEASQYKASDKDIRVAVSAWNLNVEQMDVRYEPLKGHRHDGGHGGPVTSISDRSADLEVEGGPVIHNGEAHIYDDIVVCDDDMYCTNDLLEGRGILAEMGEDEGPGVGPLAPGPGVNDLTEYLMGSIGVAIMFPESNGSIDANQEDWTVAEENNVINEINNAFTWWTNRINAEGLTISASWSYTAYYKQPTSYEPITRNGYTGAANQNMWTWMNEIQSDLGFANGVGGARAFANYTRAQLGTDWAFITWVADSAVDGNGQFADNTFGFALLGGPYVVMTYDNDGYGIGGMDAVMSHETGHIFYGLDEYSSSGADSDDRSGYLNCINGNAQTSGSTPPITNVGCIMRGGSSPYTNNQICGFTKGQIGWNDTDGDNIPDVLDTFPGSTLDKLANGGINTTSVTYWGNVSVKPLQNMNPWGPGNSITLNKINLVQYRLDGGGWSSATPVDGSWSNHSEAFKVDLSGLTEGSHTIDIRARNSQNNWEQPPYANDTFIVDFSPPTSEVEDLPQYHTDLSFPLNWTADDGSGPGVSGFLNIELYYRKDGGPWTKYMNKFMSTPITFFHEGDGLYEFYSIAFDNASNREDPPASPDASTTVESTPPISGLGPLPMFTKQVSFNIPFTASDAGVGMGEVELFFRKDDGAWTSYGTDDVSPFSFTSTGDGKYDFYVIGTDSLGNTEQKPQLPERTVTVDTVTPTTDVDLNGVQGANGWYVTGVLVTMTTDEPVGHLNFTEYRINDGLWVTYDTTFTLHGDAMYDIDYYSQDLAGNMEATKNIYLKVDTTPPVGSIKMNGGNASTSVPTVRVDIAASDSISVVTEMVITEDPTFSGASWTNLTDFIYYDLTSSAGRKTLYAMFRNSAGLVSDAIEASIILDDSFPTVRINSPDDNASLATYEFAVKGTARDNLDIERVEVTVDGGTVWTLCNGTTDWDAIVSVPTDGTYTITARAFDLVGNPATASITVVIDGRVPTVDIDTPKDNSVTEKKVIPIEGDTIPGSLVKVNGAAVEVDDDGHFSSIVSLKDGTNTITVTITRPSGTITKNIRVIYVHPPIIISDLKHTPNEPTREDKVEITCVVPGDHISKVELKWKLFGHAQESYEMTKGADGLYNSTIGPFDMGGTVEYYVLAYDDVGAKAQFPEKGKQSFNVPYIDIDPPPDPPEEDSYGMWGIMFMIILFVVFAIAIGLTMRTPKAPNVNGTKRVSGKTYEERIDPEREDGGSGFRDGPVDGDRARYRDPRHNRHRGGPPPRSRRPPPPRGRGYDENISSSELYEVGNGGMSRFRDEEL